MKRRSYRIRWRTKVAVLLSLSFCIGSFILIQKQPNRVTRLGTSKPSHPLPKPKIAFLFIARNRLPLDVVWDAFFKEREGKFSIYVNSRPGFLFNQATTKSRYFYGRQANDSIKVDWGEASMILAERILLRSALKDATNQRFLFLSDSFADTKEGRYNPKMHPVIPMHNWRKGSQWAALIRKHAEIIVNDSKVFPEFQKHCRRRSLPEFWRDRPLSSDVSKEHNCIPDEHYVQTLLAQHGLEDEITRRSLTHTVWDMSASKDRERRGWHPLTHRLSDATPKLVKTIQKIDNIYYETEYRREWCSSRGKPSPCFLFARKFTRAAALNLLKTGALTLK